MLHFFKGHQLFAKRIHELMQVLGENLCPHLHIHTHPQSVSSASAMHFEFRAPNIVSFGVNISHVPGARMSHTVQTVSQT